MRFVVSVLVAMLLFGCARDGMHTVRLKDQAFEVELALDHPSRERGLMFRDKMSKNHGMLFVFTVDSPQSFWMRNTHIPLDIMYFDGNRGFVSASYRTPPCSGGTQCPSYPSEGHARYVLELNAGVGAALQLQRGDLIELPAELPPAR